MRRFLASFVISFSVAFSAITIGASVAAPPVPSGTLTLLTASPALGEIASFEYTLNNVNECPNGGTNKCARLQVICSQAVSEANPDGIVYGEAMPAVHPTDVLLGGTGISEWLQVGGPADCVATLYYWDFHPSQVFVPLASVSFSAGG